MTAKDELREWLLSIRDEQGNRTPQAIVKAAEDESSPGHAMFEWDDSVAADKYRVGQARQLCRSLKVVYREATEKEPAVLGRAFHSVPTPSGRSYEPVEDILDDEFSRKLVLAEMEREWKALHRKYAQFEEFVQMVVADVA